MEGDLLTLQKQSYLRSHIAEQGYDVEEFADYMAKAKPEGEGSVTQATTSPTGTLTRSRLWLTVSAGRLTNQVSIHATNCRTSISMTTMTRSM